MQPDRQVSSVRPVKIDSSRWVVNVTDLRRGRNESSEYDAVIAACGHYTVPFIPEYEGMKEFANQHQRVISHSKWFDDPEAFRDQVLVPRNCIGLDYLKSANKVSRRFLS